MKSSIANNVIPFRKSQELHRFNIIPHEWRVLANEEGKKLNDKELQTLWTLKRLAEYQQSEQLVIDYAFLIYQCGFDCSQRQMSRYLNSIKSTKIISYTTQNEAHGYKKKIHLQFDYNILENLMTTSYDSQVCRSNMVRYNIDKNKLQNKELNSFPKEKEFNSSNLKACAREETTQPKKPSADLLSFSKGAANHADYLNEKQPNKNEKSMQAYDWDNPAKKLDLAISKNFDIVTATTLTTDIDYCYYDAREIMQLRFKKLPTITEGHKVRLRQLIRDIYGDNTQILCVLPKAANTNKKVTAAKITHDQEKFNQQSQEQPKNEDLANNPLWQKVEQILIERYGLVIKAWFIRTKITEGVNQLIFEASDTTANYITDNFLAELTNIAAELKITFQFLAKNRFDQIRESNINEKGKW